MCERWPNPTVIPFQSSQISSEPLPQACLPLCSEMTFLASTGHHVHNSHRTDGADGAFREEAARSG